MIYKDIGLSIEFKKDVLNTEETKNNLRGSLMNVLKCLFKKETMIQWYYDGDKRKNITGVVLIGYDLKRKFRNDVYEEELKNILKPVISALTIHYKIEFELLQTFTPKPVKEQVMEFIDKPEK